MDRPRRAMPDDAADDYYAPAAPEHRSDAAPEHLSDAAPEHRSDYDDYDDYDEPSGPIRISDPDEPRHGRSVLRTVITLVVSIGVLAALGFFLYTKGAGFFRSFSAEDYDGPGTDEVVVTIPLGSGSADMGRILVDADVVASAKAWTNAVNSSPTTFEKIQAGDHKMLTQMKASDALDLLADPTSIVANRITIPEGFRNSQVFSRINEETGVSVEDLTALDADPSGLGLPSWAPEGVSTEGFLFPETYSYGNDPSATDLLKMMVTQFNSVASSVNLEHTAAELGYSPYQVLVVASIIEKEGANPAYASDIAQVIYNRLAINMPLQLDSTVLYANAVEGKLTTTDAERDLDSPYNTYKYAGLPPGPISNPGRVALEAALNPTEGNYLYFVAVNPTTGDTKFASDAAGHDANVKEFQAWCRANPDECGA